MIALLVAAVPWTYWFAPVLFVAAVLLDLTIAVLYVKKFVLPRLVVKLMEDNRAVERPVEMRPRHAVEQREAAAA